MANEIKIINARRVAVNGFLYVWSRDGSNGKQHWDCKRVRNKECSARMVTQKINGVLTIKKGGKETDHQPSHAPDNDEVRAEEIKFSVKRKAEEANLPPSAILQGLCD